MDYHINVIDFFSFKFTFAFKIFWSNLFIVRLMMNLFKYFPQDYYEVNNIFKVKYILKYLIA